jgi:para-aminobenzoate synthetase component 1
MLKMTINEMVFKNGVQLSNDDPLFDNYQQTPEFSNGCFETMLAKAGTIPLIDAHFDRLHRGLDYLGLTIPTGLSKNRLLSVIQNVFDISSGFEQFRIRLTVIKNSTGNSEWYLHIKPITESLVQVHLDVSDIIRKVNSIEELSCKLSDRKDYAAAFTSAITNGFNDALMLTEEGHVSETAIANILWLKDNILYSPSKKSLPLDGVGLQTLHEAIDFCIRQNENSDSTRPDKYEHPELKFKDVHLDELLQSDGVWILNSVKGPIKVARIGSENIVTSDKFHILISENYWNYVNRKAEGMIPIKYVSSRNDIIQELHELRKVNDVIFLDSQLKTHPSSQNSYLFGKFVAILTYKSGVATILDHGNGTEETFESDPWKALEVFRSRYPGYICGYLGYDLKNYREKLTSSNSDPVQLPEMWMGSPALVYILDENDSSMESGNDLDNTFTVKVDQITEQQRYIQNINKAQEYITEGDVYEVNISHQIQATFKGDAWSLYENMRQRGPVPYGAYLKLGESEICCASPERFLKKVGSEIISDPIKGTRPRGGNPMDDDAILEQLRTSEKDKAENLMIVDLVRNDFNRVCEPGSVTVHSLFEIQSFGTVHQMVSRVSGKLKSTVTDVESIAACFPMGSMTGAPKIRAMEIIEKLENYKRGLYSGAIGFFAPDGNFNFNVVIRSAIIQDEKLYYSTGGAITSDSDAEMEWDETLIKMRALGVNLSKMAE